jgi:molybdopterin-guanine dinucleotide biosynthesis protein A
MVEHVVSVVAARCAPVIVVAAPGQPLPELPGAQVLRDEVRGVGPLLATGRGLRAAAEAGCAQAFVCAVDMPYLTAGLIDELSGYAGADGPGADGGAVDVVLPWDGRDHYLAGVYRTGLAAVIDALVAEGQRSMRALTERVLTQRVVLPPTRALTNLNTEADLRDIAP